MAEATPSSHHVDYSHGPARNAVKQQYLTEGAAQDESDTASFE